MQDYDVSVEDEKAATPSNIKLRQARELSRLTLKRLIAFISFGPGVLGFLWIISRILRR